MGFDRSKFRKVERYVNRNGKYVKEGVIEPIPTTSDFKYKFGPNGWRGYWEELKWFFGDPPTLSESERIDRVWLTLPITIQCDYSVHGHWESNKLADRKVDLVFKKALQYVDSSMTSEELVDDLEKIEQLLPHLLTKCSYENHTTYDIRIGHIKYPIAIPKCRFPEETWIDYTYGGAYGRVDRGLGIPYAVKLFEEATGYELIQPNTSEDAEFYEYSYLDEFATAIRHRHSKWVSKVYYEEGWKKRTCKECGRNPYSPKEGDAWDVSPGYGLMCSIECLTRLKDRRTSLVKEKECLRNCKRITRKLATALRKPRSELQGALVSLKAESEQLVNSPPSCQT